MLQIPSDPFNLTWLTDNVAASKMDELKTKEHSVLNNERLRSDSATWWNYSEKGAGDDYELKIIEKLLDYDVIDNTIDIQDDYPDIKYKIRSNLWKPMFPTAIRESSVRWKPSYSASIDLVGEENDKETWKDYANNMDWIPHKEYITQKLEDSAVIGCKHGEKMSKDLIRNYLTNTYRKAQLNR